MRISSLAPIGAATTLALWSSVGTSVAASGSGGGPSFLRANQGDGRDLFSPGCPTDGTCPTSQTGNCYSATPITSSITVDADDGDWGGLSTSNTAGAVPIYRAGNPQPTRLSGYVWSQYDCEDSLLYVYLILINGFTMEMPAGTNRWIRFYNSGGSATFYQTPKEDSVSADGKEWEAVFDLTGAPSNCPDNFELHINFIDLAQPGGQTGSTGKTNNKALAGINVYFPPCGGGSGTGGSCDATACAANTEPAGDCKKWSCVGENCVSVDDDDNTGTCGPPPTPNSCEVQSVCQAGTCTAQPNLSNGESCVGSDPPAACKKFGCGSSGACVAMSDPSQNGFSCGTADPEKCEEELVCSNGSCDTNYFSPGDNKSCDPDLTAKQDEDCVEGTCGTGGSCEPSFLSGVCSSNVPDTIDSCYTGNSCGSGGICGATYKADEEPCNEIEYPPGISEEDKACFYSECDGGTCTTKVNEGKTCTIADTTANQCYKPTGGKCSAMGECMPDVPKVLNAPCLLPDQPDDSCFAGDFCDGSGACERTYEAVGEDCDSPSVIPDDASCHDTENGKCVAQGDTVTVCKANRLDDGRECDVNVPIEGSVDSCYYQNQCFSGKCEPTFRDVNFQCDNPPNPNDDCYEGQGKCVGGVGDDGTVRSERTCKPVSIVGKEFDIDFNQEIEDCRLKDKCIREDESDMDSTVVRAEQYKASTVVCREAVEGGCDVEEKCTGDSASCPVDVVKPKDTPCRPVANICDKGEEVCDGVSPNCPDDDLYDIGYTMKCATTQFICGPLDGFYSSNNRGIYRVGSGDYTCNVGVGKFEMDMSVEMCDPEGIGPGGKCPPNAKGQRRGLSNYSVMKCDPEEGEWVCCGKCEEVDGVWSCAESGYSGCPSLPDGGNRFLRGPFL